MKFLLITQVLGIFVFPLLDAKKNTLYELAPWSQKVDLSSWPQKSRDCYFGTLLFLANKLRADSRWQNFYKQEKSYFYLKESLSVHNEIRKTQESHQLITGVIIVLTFDFPDDYNIYHNLCKQKNKAHHPGLTRIKQQYFYPFDYELHI